MSSPVAVPAAPVAPVAPPAEGRTAWVDNLRTLMIVLVVNFHACITYSHVGDWYYFALPKPGLGPTVAFALWEAHLQAFFMGLLFFVGGYFADRSLARRGARAFMRERLRRLGVPTLFYMLAIQPLIVIGMHPKTEPFAAPWTEYARYVLSGQFVGSNGPMWFAFALLIFCGVFALVGSRAPRVRFTPWSVLIFAVTLGLVTFLVRLVQPMGTNILNFRLGFFPQYIAAFVLGIAVSRREPPRSARRSLRPGPRPRGLPRGRGH
jgi:fucose 4-O-acetylase-like acetyltransferase